ncbi:latent-transforming growth factor beta-binding protein 1-like [Centruroides vittatus]|uniref:latent-transforming growth factor beta-binding protein 1-like n=1 Tax=Centruroides vittatus TaxID=120091 RepID=UPI00351026FA
MQLSYVPENNNQDKCVHICNSLKIKEICPMGCASWDKEKFKCNCTGKYEYSKDGNTCIEKALCAKGEIGDVDCSKKNARCEENKINDEGYKCVCPEGLRELENGICSSNCTSDETQKCIKKNLECEYDQNEKIARCICPLSMVMSKSEVCEFARNSYYMSIVLQNPIKHSRLFKRNVNEADKLSISYHEIKQRMIDAMTILYGDKFQTVQVIKCNLKDNDVACDIILIFNEEFKDYVRINKGHACSPVTDTNYCVLHPNLILSLNDLKTAEIVEFDNCDDRIRESFCPRVANNCTSKHPGYDCFCNKGFKAMKTFYKHNIEYEYCEDIDECLDANICGSNSNCINTFGNFTCSCRDGFVRSKNKNVFECEVSGERKIRHVLSIVGSVLGTFLLLSLLLIIILAIRLRKKSKISQRSNESLLNFNGRPVYLNQGSSHDILFQERTHHETNLNNPVSFPRVNPYRKQPRHPSVRPIEHYEDYP